MRVGGEFRDVHWIVLPSDIHPILQAALHLHPVNVWVKNTPYFNRNFHNLRLKLRVKKPKSFLLTLGKFSAHHYCFVVTYSRPTASDHDDDYPHYPQQSHAKAGMTDSVFSSIIFISYGKKTRSSKLYTGGKI